MVMSGIGGTVARDGCCTVVADIILYISDIM